MINVIRTIGQNWLSYGTQTVHIVLYWAALAWLFLYGRKTGKNTFLLYTVWAFLGITAVMAAGQLFLGGYLPYKLFLVFPAVALLAYTGVELYAQQTGRLKKRWIIAVLYVIIIQAGSGFACEPEFLAGAPNAYKIAAEVINLDRYVRKVEEPFLLAPSEVASGIQEYDPGVRVAYGEGYGYAEGDLQALLTAAKQYGCNCLLLRSETADMDYMQSEGYELIAILEGYHLYRLQ